MLASLAPPAIAGGSDEVSLTLLGTIEPSCSVTAPTTALDLGDVSVDGTINAPIGLNCNTPFVLRMTSDGGGLINTFPSGPAEGFETTIPYVAALNMPFDDGGSAISGDCTSSALLAAAACASLASGTHTAIGQTATLSLRWTAATALPRLAGTYQDVIRVSVEFAP